MAENLWQSMIEQGVAELLETARSAVFAEDDGTKRWRLPKAVGKPLWLGFDDGYASASISVSQGDNAWSQRAKAQVRPTLVVRILNLSAPLGLEPVLRFTPPPETTEVHDVRQEPDVRTYGGAWHVAEIRDHHGGEGLWRDPDGATWFKLALPDEPPYVP